MYNNSIVELGYHLSTYHIHLELQQQPQLVPLPDHESIFSGQLSIFICIHIVQLQNTQVNANEFLS